MLSAKETKKRIWRLNFFRLGFFLVMFSLLITSLFVIKGLFITLLLAFVISFLLQPVVVFLCHFGFSKASSTVITFLGIIGSTTLASIASFPFFYQQFDNLRTEFPLYIQKTVQMIENWQSQLETHFTFLKDVNLAGYLDSSLSSFSIALLEDLPSNLAQSLTILLLAPIFSFFIVKHETGITRSLYPLVPNQFFEMFLELHYKINKQIGIFIRGRLLESFIIGILVAAILLVFQVPFIVPLAIFAGIANLVPYVGPAVASAVIFLVTLINDFEPTQIAIIIGLFYGTQAIDAFVLVPLILARIVNLHPLTVIVIIIAGAQFMGILGMVISIPLANALKVSIMAIYNHISDNI